MAYYRSLLVRDATGNLVCPRDAKGRDVVTLSLGNAAAASSRRNAPGYYGPSDGTVPSPSTDVAPPLNWNGFTPSPPVAGPLGVISVPIAGWWRGDSFTNGSSNPNGTTSFLDLSGASNPLAVVGPNALLRGVQNLVGSNPPVTQFFAFDGAGNRVYAPLQTDADHFWAWFIVRQNSWSAGAALFNGGCSMTQQIASPTLRMQTAGANNTGAPLGQWVRGIASFSSAGNDILTLAGTVSSNASPGFRKGLNFVLGANSVAGTLPIGVSLAEFQLYLGTPTAAEQLALDAIGKIRYGTTTVQFA